MIVSNYFPLLVRIVFAHLGLYTKTSLGILPNMFLHSLCLLIFVISHKKLRHHARYLEVRSALLTLQSCSQDVGHEYVILLIQG